ncbi:hypothetical protein CY34DRAFT_218932 [Suillus luteus UH-Slu-Lm8-n1]|uniref:Uncharacterized protein n=1 Tax=Suillus luteus UH-Slu-Lm8-n1 TaxID=930992 RepID=A0A0D0BCU7_9AGAM|nr:hypothetical protein CY34DRAFT_218932 [Suillus luteus UH-Slu-Lm8-n1]
MPSSSSFLHHLRHPVPLAPETPVLLLILVLVFVTLLPCSELLFHHVCFHVLDNFFIVLAGVYGCCLGEDFNCDSALSVVC